VRGHESEERFAEAIAKKHMAEIGRMLGFQARAVAVTADFLERPGQSGGVARELDGRGVGQELALPADRGLDQAAKENADGTEQQQEQPDERQRIPIIATAAGPQQNPADGGDAEQAENDADEPEIQPHIAVQNVAEFVADDSLQLVAGKHLNATTRDPDGGIAGRVSGGKGVDGLFPVKHVNLRHRHTRSDSHFLDHVEQLALVRFGGVRIHQPAAHQGGDRAAAAGQLIRFIGAADEDDRQHADGDSQEQSRVPQNELRFAAVAMVVPAPVDVENKQADEVTRRDDTDHREDEIKDQQLCLFPGPVLLGKEIHFRQIVEPSNR